MLWAIYCDLAIIKGLTKKPLSKKLLSINYDVHQCIVVFEYFSAFYAWGMGMIRQTYSRLVVVKCQQSLWQGKTF